MDILYPGNRGRRAAPRAQLEEPGPPAGRERGHHTLLVLVLLLLLLHSMWRLLLLLLSGDVGSCDVRRACLVTAQPFICVCNIMMHNNNVHINSEYNNE